MMGYGTYGVTQGPRLETAAEIKRLQRDGCHLVGSTMMPEAVLAHEMDMGYCSICISANWGAGMEYKPLDIDSINALVNKGFSDMVTFLTNYFEFKN